MIFGLPTMAAAQDGDDDAYWYVSMFSIPWAKVDSLGKLIDKDSPLVEAAIERGNIVEGKVLIHHTGNEWNVVFMTKYANWAAIDADPGLAGIAEEMWGEEARAARGEAYGEIFGDNAHRDYIYTERASAP
jgi:hypothetical protein